MKLFFLSLISILPGFIYAQNEADTSTQRRPKLELSLNITTSLSNFFGNSNNSNLLADPYLIGLKYKLKKSNYFRSAATVKSRHVSENFGERDVTENEYRLRLGIEKRTAVTKKISFYTGVDIVGGYLFSDVKTFDASFGTQIQSSQILYGGGPVMGLIWHINNRIMLSTEAALYYQSTYTSRTLSLGFPDPTPVTSKVTGYLLLPVIPSSLYITIRF